MKFVMIALALVGCGSGSGAGGGRDGGGDDQPLELVDAGLQRHDGEMSHAWDAGSDDAQFADAGPAPTWPGAYAITWTDLGVETLKAGWFCGTGPIGYDRVDVGALSARLWNSTNTNAMIVGSRPVHLDGWDGGFGASIGACDGSWLSGDAWSCDLTRTDQNPQTHELRCRYHWRLGAARL